MILNSPYISGSLTVTGNATIQGSISGTITGSATSASLAQTASSIANLNQNVQITGSLTTNGTITAQTLVVQTVTSSVVYSSGSNIFGNQLTDVQQMTGSLRITGSLIQTGSVTSSFSGLVGIGTSIPVAKLDVRTTAFTPASSGSAILVEERGGYFMAQEFYINRAGDFLSGRPSGGVGTCNTAALRVAGGGIINGNFTGGGTTSFMPSVPIGSVLSLGDLDGFIFYTTGSLTAGTVMNLANNERMRITSAGNVLIGTSTDAGYATLQVQQTYNSGYGGIKLTNTTGTWWTTAISAGGNYYFNYQGSGVAYITTSGSAVFTTTQTSGNALTINVDGSSGTPTGLRIAAGIATIGSGAKLIQVVNSAGDNLFNVLASGAATFTNTVTTTNVALNVSDSYAQNLIGAAKFTNTSAASIDLATVFPNATFTSRGISVMIQIVSASSTSNTLSCIWNLVRTITGVWTSSAINQITNGITITSITGSGTTITINFSAGAQYGTVNLMVATYA